MSKKFEWVKDVFVGIDYGTTKSAIAVVERDGSPDLHNIDEGESGSSIPSAIKLSLQQEGKNLSKYKVKSIGWWAKYAQVDSDDSTVCVIDQAKLDIGEDTISKERGLVWEPFGSITPEEIAAVMIRYLKRSVENTQPIVKGNLIPLLRSATISVPANWNPIQREATKYSAMLAGFEDVELIDEPVAALLHLWKDKRAQLGLGKTNEKIMVIDFGGGTCDIAVVKLRRPSALRFWAKENVQVILSDGNNHLGGELINKMIEEHFQSGSPLESENLTFGERRQRIEGLKIDLNKQMFNQVRAFIQKFQKGDVAWPIDWKSCFPVSFTGDATMGSTNWKLSAMQFHKMLSEELRSEIGRGTRSRSVIQAFIDLIESVANSCDGYKTFDRVILVGGSSYLYFVIPILHSIFRNLEWNRTLYRPDWPEKIVALGAAWHEKARKRNSRDFEPRFFHDVVIPTSVEPPMKLIKANKKLPISFRHATSIPFSVDQDTTELVIKILGQSQEVPQNKIDVEKILRPVGGKIVANSDQFIASAKVSVDGIITVKITEKERRIKLIPIDKYPLSRDTIRNARLEFERKYVEELDQ